MQAGSSLRRAARRGYPKTSISAPGGRTRERSGSDRFARGITRVRRPHPRGLPRAAGELAFPRRSAREDLTGLFFAEMGVVGPQKDLNRVRLMKWLQRSSLEVKFGWIFGEMGGASPADVSTRLIFDAYYKYYPAWFDEIAFFIRYYRGQDYYNIQFANDELSNLSFGITSNIMNFKQAVKFFR